jgi:hypothetical protein
VVAQQERVPVSSFRQEVYQPDIEPLPKGSYILRYKGVDFCRPMKAFQAGEPDEMKCRVVSEVAEGEWEGIEVSRLMRPVIADERSHFHKLLVALDPEATPAIYEEEDPDTGEIGRFYDPPRQLSQYIGKLYTAIAGVNRAGYNDVSGDPAPYLPPEQRRRRQRPAVVATVVEPENQIEEGDDDF